MDQPLLLNASGQEEEEEVLRRRRDEWWSSSLSDHNPNNNLRRDVNGSGGTGPQHKGQDDNDVDDPWRSSNGTIRRANNESFHSSRNNSNVRGGGSHVGVRRAPQRPVERGNRGIGDDEEAQPTAAQARHPHRPVLFQLYRLVLALGGIGNALAGTVLLVAVVVTIVRFHATFNGNHHSPDRNSSSNSNGTDDGKSKGIDEELLGPGWVWLVSSLAATHWALAAATTVALSSPSSSSSDEDRPESVDPIEQGEEAVSDGAYEIVNLDEALNGDDEDDERCCCCGCCWGGRRQRQLCGSAGIAYVSAVLSLAYLVLSAMVDLDVVSCGSECGSALLLLPDVAKSHLGVALFVMAAFHALQSLAAFGYRHQLRLLINEDATVAAAYRRRRRRRASRRPWWWQSSSGDVNHRANHSEAPGGRADCDPDRHDRDREDGWFGWVRRQGRRPNAASRPSFFSSSHNFRDDGSVDFASVQEEWMNRSMEDPHWWSRDDGDEDLLLLTTTTPSPRRRKDWDEQDGRPLGS